MAYIHKITPIIINSDFMKIMVATHYRYRLHYKYTCTEYEYMDVCACNGNTLIEVECKITKADLKNELKKEKHLFYSQKRKSKYVVIPNKYYIAITKKMADDTEVIDFINQLNPNYGIILIDNMREIYFIKEAKKLHKEKVTDKILDSIVNRISSENINLRKKIYQYKIDKKKDTE